MTRRFLPFHPRFHAKLRARQKTKTARSKAYGKPGDILDTPVGPIRLLAVDRVSLSEVANHHWPDEGVSGPAEFEAIWNELHPLAGFRPSQKVYLHTFEVLG